MKTIEKNNDEKIENKQSDDKVRLSKKRRAKIDKINKDSSLNET